MVNVLKANELLYLSMLCGAKEVFGLPDVFYGKTDYEIKKLVDETSESCAGKGLFSVDFDGKTKFNDEVGKFVKILATAEIVTELIIRNTNERQKRYLIYNKQKDRVIMFESGGEYFITGEPELEKTCTGVQALFADIRINKTETSGFTITADEVAEIRAGLKPKSSIIRALMHDKGVDELTVSLVTEAIAGRAGYFSAVTVSRLNKDIATAVFIIVSGLVCQVSTDRKSSIHFTVVDNQQATQAALSFIGGDRHV